MEREESKGGRKDEREEIKGRGKDERGKRVEFLKNNCLKIEWVCVHMTYCMEVLYH